MDRLYELRLHLKGGEEGSAPSTLTVRKCEHFGPLKIHFKRLSKVVFVSSLVLDSWRELSGDFCFLNLSTRFTSFSLLGEVFVGELERELKEEPWEE